MATDLRQAPRCVIRFDAAKPEDTRVFVDGIDIGQHAAKIDIEIRPDRARVTIHIVDPIVEASTDEVTVYRACANCLADLNGPPTVRGSGG